MGSTIAEDEEYALSFADGVYTFSATGVDIVKFQFDRINQAVAPQFQELASSAVPTADGGS